MTDSQVRIEEYIAAKANVSRELITPETLITSGLVDSFLVVDIVSFLEQLSGIRIQDDYVTPDHLDSLSLMQNLVDSFRAAPR
jgi:acyl carrier protein